MCKDVCATLPDRIRLSCEAEVMALNAEPGKGAVREDSVLNQQSTYMLRGTKTYFNMWMMA